MKPLTKKVLITLLFSSFGVFANEAPIVNAGHDTTTHASSKFNFKGSAVDTTLPNGEIVFNWSIISGPDNGATILQPGFYASSVSFKKTGLYTFLLTGSDGLFSDSDTVVITILDSILFKVLKPTNKDTVHTGSTYTIQWQVDPFGLAVTVALSTDGGKNYVALHGGAQRYTDKFAWDVASDLPNSNQCKIRVQDYKESSTVTYSDIFTISTTPLGVKHAIVPHAQPSQNFSNSSYTFSGRQLTNTPGSPCLYITKSGNKSSKQIVITR